MMMMKFATAILLLSTIASVSSQERGQHPAVRSRNHRTIRRDVNELPMVSRRQLKSKKPRTPKSPRSAKVPTTPCKFLPHTLCCRCLLRLSPFYGRLLFCSSLSFEVCFGEILASFFIHFLAPQFLLI